MSPHKVSFVPELVVLEASAEKKVATGETSATCDFLLAFKSKKRRNSDSDVDSVDGSSDERECFKSRFLSVRQVGLPCLFMLACMCRVASFFIICYH